MVAAFGNFQVGVVARGQFDALGRHQINIGVVFGTGRCRFVYGAHYLLVLLGAGNCQHGRVHAANQGFFHTHAARDNNPAIFCQCFANGFQRLGLGAVDESTGIDYDNVGVVVVGRDGVAFGSQLRKNTFGIYQRLGAAQADKTDFGGAHDYPCWALCPVMATILTAIHAIAP